MKTEFELTQRTANRLIKLMNEMYHIIETDEPVFFSQGSCNSCVIGNGIRAGVMNGFKDTAEFEEAIEWLGLPDEVYADGSLVTPHVSGQEGKPLAGYMFGNSWGIGIMSKKLGFPVYTENGYHTAKSAIKRIKKVLNVAGYGVVDK